MAVNRLPQCFGSDWHFADKTTAPGFVASWTNNGQSWISARVGYDAIAE